jgi:hypothetical protein
VQQHLAASAAAAAAGDDDAAAAAAAEGSLQQELANIRERHKRLEKQRREIKHLVPFEFDKQ